VTIGPVNAYDAWNDCACRGVAMHSLATQLYNLDDFNEVTGSKLRNWQDGVKRNMLTQLENDRGRFLETQIRTDVGMWYGAAQTNGAVRRFFKALYFGGLHVFRHGAYQPWADLNTPLATAVSHGGRVLIQLPPAPSKEGNQFWNWLNSGSEFSKRTAATHGVQRLSGSEAVRVSSFHTLRVKEVSKSGLGTLSGHHYGMNLALGGAGSRSPFDGNIIAASGGAGHMYANVLAPSSDHEGAILIGAECARPTGVRGDAKADHLGGGHGTGAANLFSATGGLKFTEKQKTMQGKKKVKVVVPNDCFRDCGPTIGNNGLVMVLDAHRIHMILTQEFNDEMIGQVGLPPGS